MQILKKKELSRKSELKEYWGRYCGQNLQSWLGFSAGGGGDVGMKGRVNRKLQVCLVSVRMQQKVLAGTGLGAAGASNRGRSASGTGCISHGSSAQRWRKPLRPGRASLRCSPHLYRSVPLPAAACRAWPCGKVHTPQSPFNSSNPRHSSLRWAPSTPFSPWRRQQLRAVVLEVRNEP
jgi:hypothetical protein